MKGKLLPFLSFTAKSLILLSVLYLFARLIRDQPIWSVALGVLVVATPIFFALAYRTTIYRVFRLQAFRNQGIVFALFSGRLLRLIFWLFWALFSAYFLLISFSMPIVFPWLTIGLVIPLFWFYYLTSRSLIKSEIKPYLVTYMATIWARRLTTVTMIFIYFVVTWYLVPHLDYKSFAEAIDAQEKAVGNIAGSDLVYWTHQWLAFYNGTKAYLVGASISGDILTKLFTLKIGDVVYGSEIFKWVLPAVLTLLFGGVFYHSMCLMLSAVVIPRREWHRLFAPISDADISQKNTHLHIALISGVTTLFAFFIFVPGIAYLNQSLSQNPQLSSLRAKGEPVHVKLERIGEYYYRDGTRQEIENLKIAMQAVQKEHQATLIKNAEEAFNTMESNVDGYLDWYYSLNGEYSRLGRMLIGGLDKFMQAKLKEHLEMNDPFRSFTASLNAIGETDDVKQRIQALLNQNRVELPPDQFVVVKHANLDEMLTMPTHFDMDTLKQRLGTSALVGSLTAIVAGKITAKMASKSILGFGAKAAAKMAASKGAGVLGGTAAGAAVGATAGSIFPIVGTAAGAAIGGIAAGIFTGLMADKGMVELEEHSERDKLKQELMAVIRVERENFIKRINIE